MGSAPTFCRGRTPLKFSIPLFVEALLCGAPATLIGLGYCLMGVLNPSLLFDVPMVGLFVAVIAFAIFQYWSLCIRTCRGRQFRSRWYTQLGFFCALGIAATLIVMNLWLALLMFPPVVVIVHFAQVQRAMLAIRVCPAVL